MSKYTPMMQQYLEIKENYKHCLLFFRLGDFYELFFEDAITASQELNIALTGRECGKGRAHMCGVPYHSVNGYIGKLVEKGYNVAICEQIEPAGITKGIVKRDVVKVVTPGTVMDSNLLDESRNNYVMSIFENKEGFGIAYSDVTTGLFNTSAFNNKDSSNIVDEIARISPKEVIVNDEFSISNILLEAFNVKVNKYYSWGFEYNNAYKALCNQLQTFNLNGVGLEDKLLCICASGALVEFLRQTQKNTIKHISSIQVLNYNKYMTLDISSRRNLELTENMREKSKKGSLIWVLDKTKTSMGSRMLNSWVSQPLIVEEDIKNRLDAVEEYKNNIIVREELRETLGKVYDIERIMGRIIYGTANPRDLISLKKSFSHLPGIKELLSNFNSSLNTEMHKYFDELNDIFDIIDKSINEEPPVNTRDGGIIKDGFDKNLDHYREARNNGSNWLDEMLMSEKEKTGIKNLKISYSKVFGYCFEVTNSYKNLVPGYFTRRQTLSNCERFTTQELKEIEDAILGADENIMSIENQLFLEIRNKISSYVDRIKFTANLVSVIDALQSLAEAADENNYVKPEINDSGGIYVKKSRHPVVEKLLKTAFIPNDIYLNNKEDRISVITGPNMAGKSTYMRQVALIVIMAQIGSYIPADEATMGIVDRVFTRIGASDDLATGQSTFMIEMNEVANIINNATNNSLLILDEIGRGTSTDDGLSIAWSVLEYIADKILAKTLFSTHYHQLTGLEGRTDGVKNYHMSIQEDGEDIVFLRTISRGFTNKSYGMHVAKLAGLPSAVLTRASEILEIHTTGYSSAGNSRLYNDTYINNEQTANTVDYSKYKPIDPEINKIIIEELKKAASFEDAIDRLNVLKGKYKQLSEER